MDLNALHNQAADYQLVSGSNDAYTYYFNVCGEVSSLAAQMLSAAPCGDIRSVSPRGLGALCPLGSGLMQDL